MKFYTTLRIFEHSSYKFLIIQTKIWLHHCQNMDRLGEFWYYVQADQYRQDEHMPQHCTCTVPNSHSLPHITHIV